MIIFNVVVWSIVLWLGAGILWGDLVKRINARSEANIAAWRVWP